MTPVDIPPLSMTQGAAESRWNNNGEAGAESRMNDDLRSKSGNSEAPEEKRDQNDSTADPQEPCKKTGKGAQENEHGKNVESEWRHMD